MYHFVALLWNPENPAAREQALELDQKMRRSGLAWECHLTAAGLVVFALPPEDPGLRPYVLPGGGGVVLGRLFSADLRNPHRAERELVDERTTGEILRTAGRHLVENFWGGYVALLCDSDARSAYAIRDCSGKLPCYHTRYGALTIVFADVADLAPLELPSFTINWGYLAAFIYSSQLQVRACAFKEVQEVLGGECLEVRGGDSHQTAIWNPREVVRARRIDSYEVAVTELKQVTQQCIDAWVQTYDPILLGLSGGFDSAVVLGCLNSSAAHPRITCLNQFTAAAHEDERRYARLAAARAGLTLLEVPMQSAADRFDSRLLAGPMLLKPSVPALFRLLETELMNRVSLTTGARTLWTGQGGDHIFLQTADASSAGDYLVNRGIRPGFIGAVRDAACLSRQPYWHVLKSAWKTRAGSSAPPPGLARTPYFIDPTTLPANVDDYVSHPWVMDDAEAVPSCKRMQIRFLAEVINRHRPIPRRERAPQHHPLLSQPVVELCLQIPTYLLLRGGRERALARAAFADRVPPEIIRRRDKGSIVSHATEMLRESEEFVRGLLLEGALADARVIAPADLEPYIVDGQPFREDHLLPLLACIAAEVWVRTCTGSPVAAAA
jgi:asparagine synthase (glutamine-hydrolysing)